jgi:hypothetical protein
MELTARELRIQKEGFINNYSRGEIRKSLTREANSYVDICEILRLIYDLVYTVEDPKLKNEITEKLINAMRIVKRMADRLTYYKITYKDMTGTSGRNIKHFPGAEERKAMRRARP